MFIYANLEGSCLTFQRCDTIKSVCGYASGCVLMGLFPLQINEAVRCGIWKFFFIRLSAQTGWEMKQDLVLPYIQYWTKRVHLHTTRYKAHTVCTCFHHRKQTNCHCQSCGGCACWHISSVSNPNLMSCRPRQHYKASCCFSVIVLPSKMSFWTRSKAESPAECEENPTMHCSELKYTCFSFSTAIYW